MFERFTDRARRALVLASDEAMTLGLPSIDSNILLLGIAAEREGAGAVALARLGITAESLRASIEALPVTSVTEQPAHVAKIAFTSRAKKALELSLREALQLGHNYISTEHILLGISRQGESLLADHGAVRHTVIELLSEYANARQATVERPERRRGRERRAGGDERKAGQ